MVEGGQTQKMGKIVLTLLQFFTHTSLALINLNLVDSSVTIYKSPARPAATANRILQHVLALRGGKLDDGLDDSGASRAWPQLLSENGVLLVMRGTPDRPACADSAELVDILASEDLSFEHFDVLQNEPIELPFWPPLPQALIPCCDSGDHIPSPPPAASAHRSPPYL